MSLSIVVLVTHLLGVGHLTRAAAIGRALARRGHRVTLVSGGMDAPLVPRTGMRFVALPPVRTRPGDFRTLLDAQGEPVGPELSAARRAILAGAIERARPDVLVTELFPFGRRVLAAEFLHAIACTRAVRPDAAIACSIRDILAAPTRPERIAETHARLESYDAILVHGDPAIVPLEASWPLAAHLRGRLHYTGYVDSAEPLPAPAALPEQGGILVSGGGSAAGLPLFEAALQAAVDFPVRPWRLLAGAGIAADAYARLQAAAPAHVQVERARPDFRSLVAAAALSVSQAGYNTAIDLLAAGTPAVLVPYEEAGETEQRLRAEVFAAQGRAVVLREADLDAKTLAAAIRSGLALPRHQGPAWPRRGADDSADVIEAIAPRPRRRHSKRDGDGWAILRTALDRAADAGCALPFWWRDDDAVASTPALERLIALSGRTGCPLALAAVPALCQPSLAERIRPERAITVLVHGWSHANHAPPGEKKAEFGAGRPSDEARGDAAHGLAAARRLFGAQLVPVFVPPWNRIAPDVATQLPDLGYRALSTFRSGTASPARSGTIPRIDTHCDPIDWHRGRGLAEPEALLNSLAAAVTARLRDTCPEPIGLLTHHLVSSEAVWAFCERLIGLLAEHPGARVTGIDEVLETHMRREGAMALGERDGLQMVTEGRA